MRSFTPHRVTRAIDSAMIFTDIFEVPTSRSTNVIGSSTRRSSACTIRKAVSFWKAYPLARMPSMSIASRVEAR